MTVHVVIREDQNHYGFVDTSVVGLFRHHKQAEAFVRSSCEAARAEGLRVEGDPDSDPDWHVCWSIELHQIT